MWNFKGDDLIICANGIKWLHLLPIEGTYAITAMINSKNDIELVELCKECRTKIEFCTREC